MKIIKTLSLFASILVLGSACGAGSVETETPAALVETFGEAQNLEKLRVSTFMELDLEIPGFPSPLGEGSGEPLIITEYDGSKVFTSMDISTVMPLGGNLKIDSWTDGDVVVWDTTNYDLPTTLPGPLGSLLDQGVFYVDLDAVESSGNADIVNSVTGQQTADPRLVLENLVDKLDKVKSVDGSDGIEYTGTVSYIEFLEASGGDFESAMQTIGGSVGALSGDPQAAKDAFGSYLEDKSFDVVISVDSDSNLQEIDLKTDFSDVFEFMFESNFMGFPEAQLEQARASLPEDIKYIIGQKLVFEEDDSIVVDVPDTAGLENRTDVFVEVAESNAQLT